ncbi:biosynthetic peptidoglycan transglycosylase, partial [Nonomuraea recticatena]|uniref:transglycosylase domain-containing protein n=1 Tax=Nonomuraea recticatena TaxID=46178 RepID=UPI0031F94E3A
MRVRNSVLKLLGLCVLAGVLLAGALFPAVGALGVVSNQASDTVDSISSDLVTTDPPLITTITDRDGAPIAYLYDQYRVLVPPEDISPTMKAALVSVEDRRFYEHQGVDWKGTTRAALTNQFSGSVTQGASTLTQQYVKNYLAFVVGKGSDEAYEKATAATMARKLSEARIAMQLEQKMTKEEILTAYLNVVPFGNGTYGVGAAAQTYFNTTADKLTVPQAALLAGLANRPSALNPEAGADAAMERRNTVIDYMRNNGAFGEDTARADQLTEEYKAAPIGVVEDLKLLPMGCVGAGD